jgi:hypothetical protein
MATRKSTKKLYATEATRLDPMHCGSEISYSIYSIARSRGKYLYADIHLSDCSRKIQWDFSNTEYGLAKMDKIIGILENFRENFKIAKKDLVKPKRKKAVKKKTIPARPRAGVKYLQKD